MLLVAAANAVALTAGGIPIRTDPAGVPKSGRALSRSSGRELFRLGLLAGTGAGRLLGMRVLFACTMAVRPG